MPEMTFTVRWPDGGIDECYSPSQVLHDHLDAGAEYSVAEFVRRSTDALDEASRRVRAKYGFECTSAMQQKAEIAARSSTFDDAEPVRVLAMHPPLPVPIPT
jgi:uncharacterized repeat protein (TIGR04042 family)